jgi:putative inorganic carbon (HCO3(-)) transporter
MSQHLSRKRSVLGDALKYHFLEKKLNTGYGYVLLALLAITTAYATMIDFKIGLGMVILFVAILVIIIFLKYPYIGFYFMICFSSIIITLDRLIHLPFPFNVFLEPFTLLLFLGVLRNYDLRKQVDRKFWTNPITIGQYFLFAYYMIELFNPAMLSTLGWFSFIRKQLSFFIFYYVAYSLLNTKARIYTFIYFMITLSTILALYACKQQFIGYADFELRSVGTGGGYILLFQGGLLRKFSVFSDPATSGIYFASVAMLCIIMWIRDPDKIRRRWLSFAIIANILGYSFSGTRTATLMIVAAIAFYTIATAYEKKTLAFLIVCIMIFTTIMTMPYQNVVTNRIRSTFDGTKDASAAIRDYDRHQIQPYIHEHPIGGGIYTAWAEGPKYNPGHFLETFQPDSGYAKSMAELGPVGLIILLMFYLVVMRQGIRNFYRAKDPSIQTLWIALTIMIFTLFVAQYSQQAITQYPIIFYFYGTLVVLVKLIDFDKEPKSEKFQI